MVDCIYQKEDDRRFILCVLLHAADIGNPVKPLATYNKWTDRVLSEFFTQGDLEQKFGLPKSPMMDPAATNKPMSQINFIEFVVAPLYANFSKLFPESGELVGHLLENRVYFQTVLELELDGEAGGVGGVLAVVGVLQLLERWQLVLLGLWLLMLCHILLQCW